MHKLWKRSIVPSHKVPTTYDCERLDKRRNKMIHVCECPLDDCHTHIPTSEYNELILTGLGGFITLHSHVPVGCTILAKTEHLYLRTHPTFGKPPTQEKVAEKKTIGWVG